MRILLSIKGKAESVLYSRARLQIGATVITSTCVLFLLMSTLCFAEQSVQGIVDASGFEGGLIVHVGCADGEITAELYKEGRLVLGLDADLENIARARAHFLEKGVR